MAYSSQPISGMGIAILALVPGIASAQTETAPEVPQSQSAGTENSGAGIQDIVVTAQRRSENMQRVPITIQAITSESLTKNGITGTDSLSTQVSGLVVANQAGIFQPFMRGVGTQSSNLGSEGVVPVYIDGVYIPAMKGSIFDFNNIERVEVLKGPQGTLFGRNSTGGLINVITKTPSASPEFRGSLEYGSFERVRTSLYATGGKEDVFAADIALYYTDDDGYGRNVYLNQNVFKNHTFSARGKLVGYLSDNLTVTLSGDYTKSHMDAGTSATLLPGFTAVGGYTNPGSIYKTLGGVDPNQTTKAKGASLKINWEVSSDVKIQSISAYRYQTTFNIFDQDQTPLRSIDVYNPDKAKSFQQEFLIESSLGKLDVTTGLFYLYRMVCTCGTTEQDGYVVRSSTTPTNNYLLTARFPTNSYSAFIDATYPITDELKVTGGIRYTKDSRSISGYRVILAPNPSAPPGSIRNVASQSQTTNDITWRGVLGYQVTPAIYTYASISKGFNSGTWSLSGYSQPAVNPEYLTAKEIGVKADLFDRMVRLNVSGFHYNYRDIQLNQSFPGGNLLTNAARAELYGVDVDLSIAHELGAGRLQFNLGGEWLHARYTDYQNAQFIVPNPSGPGALARVGDATGNHTVKSPPYTLNITTNYTVPVGSGTLDLNVSFYRNGGFYWEPDNFIHQDAYNLVNAQIGYAPDEHLRFVLFARNLFDKQYLTYETSGVQGYKGTPAEPRYIGGRIEVNF